ncbi:DCC1-like thiol-disulfide oxidoreductase family protein [Mesorhizobium sp.]|uniref:thiol-disulfide oxidoreductase DCC family protein n=1 Tax=Mesorhizobium sp. TaxID=1871066 RepID=UPI0025C2F289|nr:DCC1-like thiol-disulfide oxidoreductase family protein [Mesorhizobium sp.]
MFDGVCVFCSGFVQIVLKIDRKKRFRLATAESPLGEALFREHGLPTEDYDSNLAIIDGAAFTKLDSFVAVMAALGWPWRAARLLLVLPRPLRDWLYDRIAKNRCALFGRKHSCEIPSAELRQRLIS